MRNSRLATEQLRYGPGVLHRRHKELIKASVGGPCDRKKLMRMHSQKFSYVVDNIWQVDLEFRRRYGPATDLETKKAPPACSAFAKHVENVFDKVEPFVAIGEAGGNILGHFVAETCLMFVRHKPKINSFLF